MRLLLIWIGRLAAVTGVLVSMVAVLARVSGAFHVGSFEASTLLLGGIAAMVLGCLAYLTAMAEPGSR